MTHDTKSEDIRFIFAKFLLPTLSHARRLHARVCRDKACRHSPAACLWVIADSLPVRPSPARAGGVPREGHWSLKHLAAVARWRRHRRSHRKRGGGLAKRSRRIHSRADSCSGIGQPRPLASRSRVPISAAACDSARRRPARVGRFGIAARGRRGPHRLSELAPHPCGDLAVRTTGKFLLRTGLCEGVRCPPTRCTHF